MAAERSIRANLTVFFVYLFADLDDFLHPNPTAALDSQAFLAHRRAARSGCLQEFLQEFLRSQMFERFCEQRRSRPPAARRSGQVDRPPTNHLPDLT